MTSYQFRHFSEMVLRQLERMYTRWDTYLTNKEKREEQMMYELAKVKSAVGKLKKKTK